MASIHVGDLHRVSATFRNAAGVPTNPTSVTFRLRTPAGVVTTPAPVSDGSGVYHYDVNVTQVGRYEYAFSGTGSVVAAEPGDFYVQRARVLTEPVTP